MSVRIAVISDSHIGQRISTYPNKVLNAIRESDIIIHAGDHTSIDSLELLESCGDLRAVHGNMDDVMVCSKLPPKIIFEVEGVRIGVTHGWGAPTGLAGKVVRVFDGDEKPNIVIFGHSHVPLDEIIDGIRMLNPGAVSGNLFSGKSSFGILTIDERDIDWELIEFQF